MNGHVAVLVLPANGHIYPSLGLCSELVRRGYRVTCPVEDRFADKVRKTGAEIVRIEGYEEYKEAERKNISHTLPVLDHDWWQVGGGGPETFSAICAHSASMLKQLDGFYEKNTPNLLIHDRWQFAGHVLARRLNVPAVQISGVFAIYNNLIIRDNGVCLNPKSVAGINNEIASFFSAQGIKEENGLWCMEKLNIYFIPKQFQFHADRFDSRSLFAGAALDRPRPASSWANNSRGKPIVLASDGDGNTSTYYFKTIIEALADSEFHVILSTTNEYMTDHCLGSLPDNFEINRHASHLDILPHASLAVSQGGMGNTLEPIYHGLPVIAVPMVLPSNHQVAYRIAELGLGIYLPGRELTARTMRASVGKAMGDASLLDRVTQMQKVFRSSGGAQLAANRIESYLQTECSV